MLRRFLIIPLLFFFLLPGCKETAKEPSVAGAFYPADSNSLGAMVDEFYRHAGSDPGEGRLIALISPHAAYVFSGHVAAEGYNRLKGRGIKTVIIIGASHYNTFKGASVYTKGIFKTPLGNIKIDEKIAKSLLDKEANIEFNPAVYEKEHSLEVQIPFIQKVSKDIKIVPILIGNPTMETLGSLTERLTAAMAGESGIVLAASTDLSHYHDYNTALAMDGMMVDALTRLSTSDINKYITARSSEMCGVFPVILTIRVARALGANNGVLYKYANSGDITPDRDRVVGYASVGLYSTPLTDEEKEELLNMARMAITEYVLSKKLFDPDVKNPKFRADAAVFVTITIGGQLRGCVGHTEAVMPLYKSITRNAIAASSMDPRFPPMTESEIRNMEVEISVLSPLQILNDINDIKIGRDGLVIVKEQHSGLLLPQVPVEFGWDRQTYLKQISFKAGLPENAWQTATLYRFTAEIIK